MTARVRLALAAARSLAMARAAAVVRDRIEPAPAVTDAAAIPTSCSRRRRPRSGARRCWRSQQRGWQFLQAGDLGQARARVQRGSGRRAAGFYPADAGLGYVALRTATTPAPCRGSTACCRATPRMCRRWSGKADALAGAGRVDDALAPASRTSLSTRRWRTCGAASTCSRSRASRQALEAARQAADAGRFDEARGRAIERAIVASPDSAFLYRELAAVERKAGRSDARAGASQEGRRARRRRMRERFVQLGELLEERGDVRAAPWPRTSRPQAIEPGDEARSRVASRAVPGGPCAAAGRVPGHRQRARRSRAATWRRSSASGWAPCCRRRAGEEGGVVTDARGHWAAPWIMAVVRAGIMEPYPNHAFQPRGVVQAARPGAGGEPRARPDRGAAAGSARAVAGGAAERSPTCRPATGILLRRWSSPRASCRCYDGAAFRPARRGRRRAKPSTS